jgi:hypothetical protein
MIQIDVETVDNPKQKVCTHPGAALLDDRRCCLELGLTNSVNFIKIRWIRSPPNFKIGDLLFMDSKYLKK